jgi:D-alanyl-D-alanine carboxypeptidase
MRAGTGRHRQLWDAPAWGTAIVLTAALGATPAAARTHHHHIAHAASHATSHIVTHITPAPASAASAGAAQDSGFGPTAPGVSAIVIDAASGNVISSVGADIPRYPASLTKLMVLDLTFQALRDHRMTMDTAIPVSQHAASVEPVKLGLRPGDTITVEQAILGMTTRSANDAATALGEYLGGGSEYRCGQMMTLRAHSLGMAQSAFFNASGLPNPNQVSTARDLAILARDIIVSYPEFQSFFETPKFDFEGRTIYNINEMLKRYPGATGMKTGYTNLARHNIITSADRGGRTLIGVVLHEPSWGEGYGQMTALLDQGFGTISATDIAYLNRLPTTSSDATPFHALHPAAPMIATAAPTRPAAAPRADASTQPANWTAQIGLYNKSAKARSQAVAVAHLRGVGIPRVARVEHHGKVLWTAQLAGLTQTAAHQTCTAMAARRTTCVIIAPQSDHLAERDNFDG